MKLIKYPEAALWPELLQRPYQSDNSVKEKVSEILMAVQQKGDACLKELSEKYDDVILDDIKVSESEMNSAKVDTALGEAIYLAKSNIEKFHESQFETQKVVKTQKGVKCWRKSIPIEKVGLYIPGGTAPLLSTVLMLGVPAKIAGCSEISICSPPNKSGNIDSAILFTAGILGIKNIFKVGGAQAIAAMAYGTETIPAVNKIFGPGNQYVTKAKELVQQYGVAIDMPAGPSEVLVIADESSRADFVAADLLSQAEHGEDSQVVLLCTSEDKVEEIFTELNIQLEKLPRKEIAKKALSNSLTVVLKSLSECVQMSNFYSPEHLILNTQKNEDLLADIVNAGSVFIGPYSCESAGDYASGTNHTLPTNGYAKAYSGVSLDSFMKKITFQEISFNGLKTIGPAIERMAEAEGLYAHKNAVSIRLK